MDQESWEYALQFLNLPSVSLSRLDLLPNCPALYFVTHLSSFLYIGLTDSLRIRWKNHHKIDILQSNWPSAMVRYQEIENISGFLDEEQKLIRRLRPALNGIRSGLFKTRYEPISDNLLLAQFVDLCLRPAPDATLSLKDMHECFVAFCRAFGYKSFGGPKFPYLLAPHLPGCRQYGYREPAHWKNVTPLPGAFAFEGGVLYCNPFACLPGGREAFGPPGRLEKWSQGRRGGR